MMAPRSIESASPPSSPFHIQLGWWGQSRAHGGRNARASDLFAGAPASRWTMRKLGLPAEVEPVLVFGVYAHVGVIETARDDVGFRETRRKASPLSSELKQRAVVRFGNHIDHIRVAGRDF